jgi:hypothetical protein
MALDLNDPEVKAALEARVAEETGGLKKSRDELLKETKDLKARIKALPEDFDPAEYSKLKTEAETRREQQALEAGEFEKLREQITAKHAKELEKLSGERDSALKRYQDFRVQNEVLAAITTADGIPQILLPHVMAQVQFKPGKDSAEDAVVVVDRNGQPRLTDKGEPVSLGGLIGELRADEIFSRAFKSSGASGGGAGGSGGASGGAGGKTMKRAAFEGLNAEQKMAFSKSGGTLTN